MLSQVRNLNFNRESLCERTSELNILNHFLHSIDIDNFPNGLKLRAGIYFVDSIPKTPTGKFVRRKATELAEQLFKVAKESDLDVQQHLLDISEEYRRMI